jgi:hypothetical protein
MRRFTQGALVFGRLKTTSQEWGSKSTRDLDSAQEAKKSKGDMRKPIAQRLISNEIRLIHEGKGHFEKYRILQERLGPGLSRIHLCLYFLGFAAVWALMDHYWTRRGVAFHGLIGKYVWTDEEKFLQKIQDWKHLINFVGALCLNEMLDLVRLTLLFQFKFLKVK